MARGESLSLLVEDPATHPMRLKRIVIHLKSPAFGPGAMLDLAFKRFSPSHNLIRKKET